MTNTDMTQTPQATNNDTSRGFTREMAVVPPAAYFIAFLGFAFIQVVMHVLVPNEQNPPPAVVRTILGLLAGVVVGIWILLIGYVARDAKRRGMNSVLWTFLVIFVPNALGFILYFLIRKPMQVPCFQCGTMLQPNFRFCPRCSTARYPVCGHCNTPVQPGDLFCNNCGRILHEPMK